MAVKRLWILNAPSSTIDELQKAQISIGWPLVISSPAPPIPVIPVSYGDYIRSYLGDNDSVIDQGTKPVGLSTSSSTYLNYLRSYLGDN